MANIKRMIEEAEHRSGELVEAAVVGKHYDRSWHGDAMEPDENVILGRDEALAKLDLEYDAGFGGADCYPVYAWSKSFVYFMHEHDGATDLHVVPRHPMPCAPEFGGEDFDFVGKLLAMGGGGQ